MAQWDMQIDSVADFLKRIEYDLPKHHNLLFRGQNRAAPLLPKIARKDPHLDTTGYESEMLDEFRRRLASERDVASMNEWDLLVFAQHHGMATRLLDWTSNPLFALWFACSNVRSLDDPFVYSLLAPKEDLLNVASQRSPFTIDRTYLLKPNINNVRIRAQSGWFTVHRYSQERAFVHLEANTSMHGHVTRWRIDSVNALRILETLDKLGVNEESVYPGPQGTAHYLNWLHRDIFD